MNVPTFYFRRDDDAQPPPEERGGLRPLVGTLEFRGAESQDPEVFGGIWPERSVHNSFTMFDEEHSKLSEMQQPLESMFCSKKDISGDKGSPTVPSAPPNSPASITSSEKSAEIPEKPSEESCSIKEEGGPEAAGTESSLQGAEFQKMIDLVAFLLLKYRTSKTITKEEILSTILSNDQQLFPVVFTKAYEYMLLVFGIEVQEVDPQILSYNLVPAIGLTYDGMVDPEQSLPKTGLLIMVLGIIIRDGNHSLENDMWKTLSRLGVYPEMKHFIYGDPRDLLTNVWVKEQYLEYREIPGSDPACYEFLWGPRAYAETSRKKVIELWLKIHTRDARSFCLLMAEVQGQEEHRSGHTLPFVEVSQGTYLTLATEHLSTLPGIFPEGGTFVAWCT
ncbi:melanoma-associated antigen 8-like [Sorex fumeus]|uniref:melanoma-associated antigen 8-like n=1 Tax=Sorex fumeus TaxID=62283 RepID=UPI0024ACEA74|nr:melanoma-associated antigen 8-like [Sorex fumeus]